MDYREFVASKRKRHTSVGFDPALPHETLYPHQLDIVRWACRLGRCAIFADTGLGKTRMQLAWASEVATHTNGKVLLLAPLAVSEQTIAEGISIGVDVGRHGQGHAIEVINYDRLHRVDVGSYDGVVLDESSILKAFDGRTRNMLVSSFAETPYRLACTATPAPNDHTELGNHAEFLGICTMQEMLAEFFVHDSSSSSARGWRLKGHAVSEFWSWVSSWAVVIRLPSDLGHDDGAYLLPPLNIKPHIVRYDSTADDGMLFALPAATLSDQRSVRRGSLQARVDAAVSLCQHDGQVLVWCELNDESAAVSKAVPDAVEVSGAMKADAKSDALMGFARGDVRVLVTKPSIAGFGMNWQGCARMVFVGVSHSYEMFYQAVRRCWRFGQSRPVDVFLVQTAMDGMIAQNLERKARAADEMAAQMMGHIRDEQMMHVRGVRPGSPPDATMGVEVPEWLVTQECL